MQFVSAVCLCLGYVAVGTNKKKQGWHDKAAGTLVVKQSMIQKLREDEGIFPKKKVIPKSSLKNAA